MNYWDSSAMVETFLKPEIKTRLMAEGGYSRTHTLAEMFSALTKGNLELRVSANEAARIVRIAAKYLKFVHLTEDEVFDALDQAQARGVRGGRVHDYIHAVAADKVKADALLTLDRNDFEGLILGLKIEQL